MYTDMNVEIERQDIEESKEKDKNGETVIVKKIVRKIVGSFKQFPIKIAWAMSIHKCQGTNLWTG